MEDRLNKVVEAIKDRMEKNGEIVLKSNGDRLGVMYNESEGGYMVYYYGNVYIATNDCDLIGVYPTLESFAKTLL